MGVYRRLPGRHHPLLFALLLVFIPVLGAEYLGKQIGQLSTLQYDVSGGLYAMSNTALLLVDFTYSGKGPAARFFVGTSSAKPSPGGDTIPDETGSTRKLGQYERKTIILHLRSGLTVNNIKWFSVWCVDYDMDLGSVVFPAGFRAPGPVSVGQFSQKGHLVSSGNVVIEDTKTISIASMNYDGGGPDAYFILGNGDVGKKYVKIRDENNSTAIVKGYTKKTLRLVLPAGVSLPGYRYLALYCIKFSVNFGHVEIPANIKIPVHPDTISEMGLDGSSELDNCEQMSKDFNVGWSVNSSHITLEFISILGSGEYMAFGLSGSDVSSSMLGGDVIVTQYTDDGIPMAEDYYLEQLAQCSGDKGVCPDVKFGGTQDTRVIGGSKVNKVVRVKITRALDTGDYPTDKVYLTDQEQYVIWARGRLNQQMFVTKHDKRLVGNMRIQFGRPSRRRCGNISPLKDSAGPVWQEQRISGRDTQEFHVQMGPTGGDRGYQAITGEQSWGSAYYINGYLIPQLELRRGTNYTFVVRAGYDSDTTSRYHPLYITTDPRGGYKTQSQEERKLYHVFAGLDSNGMPLPNAVGRYCEYYTADVVTAVDNSLTFAEFKGKLQSRCFHGPEAGRLIFMPDENTPEWIYYQCFIHPGLGWKIHVVDEYSSGLQVLSSVSLVLLCIIISTSSSLSL